MKRGILSILLCISVSGMLSAADPFAKTAFWEIYTTEMDHVCTVVFSLGQLMIFPPDFDAGDEMFKAEYHTEQDAAGNDVLVIRSRDYPTEAHVFRFLDKDNFVIMYPKGPLNPLGELHIMYHAKQVYE